MRYIKVLLIAVFFFLALIFFFQNQTALSQKIPLTMDFIFFPPFNSVPLPFYFLVVAGFLLGCLLSLCWLLWDKVSTSARLVKTKWALQSAEAENARLKKELEKSQIEREALTSDAGKEKEEKDEKDMKAY